MLDCLLKDRDFPWGDTGVHGADRAVPWPAGPALRVQERQEADLLAEVRGPARRGSSYVDSGSRMMPPAEALADFARCRSSPRASGGSSLAQARRTALWVTVVVPSSLCLGPVASGGPETDLSAAQALIDRLIEGLGWWRSSGALLCFAPAATGSRFLGARPRSPSHRCFPRDGRGRLCRDGAGHAGRRRPPAVGACGLPWALMFLVCPMLAGPGRPAAALIAPIPPDARVQHALDDSARTCASRCAAP